MKRVGTGGSIERDLVRRYIKRKLARLARRIEPGYTEPADSCRIVLTEFLAWLEKQPARLRRKGGLGRR